VGSHVVKTFATHGTTALATGGDLF